ncbi:dual specificity protein phosphatase 23-like [Ptychodera flava]|uniref:dual specificity protein phosphatase 23-like n=1 Tax=Ptychodera flava TaxID=63121 RepID=UPI00396A3738
MWWRLYSLNITTMDMCLDSRGFKRPNDSQEMYSQVKRRCIQTIPAAEETGWSCLPNREGIFTPFTCEAPPEFTWIDVQNLAVCGVPETVHQRQCLLSAGIKHLITLTAASSPVSEACNDLQCHRIPIGEAPTLDQVLTCMRMVDDANSKGEAVAMHGDTGHGTTGTMAACYMVKARKVSAAEAVRLARQILPGSVQTNQQEGCVETFYQFINASWENKYHTS